MQNISLLLFCTVLYVYLFANVEVRGGKIPIQIEGRCAAGGETGVAALRVRQKVAYPAPEARLSMGR